MTIETANETETVLIRRHGPSPARADMSALEYLVTVFIPSRAEIRGTPLGYKRRKNLMHIIGRAEAEWTLPRIGEMRAPLIDRYCAELAAIEGMSHSFTNHLRDGLYAIMRHAIDLGVTEDHPGAQRWIREPSETRAMAKGYTMEDPRAPGTLWHLCVTQFFVKNLTITHRDTQFHYALAIAEFGEFLKHEPTLDDLTDDNVAGMMRYLHQRGDLSRRSINGHRSCLHALWTWVAKRPTQYGLRDFPSTPQLKIPKRLPEAYTSEELVRLFEAAANRPGRVGRFKASDWWLALLGVFFDTAERKGAVLSLEWAWFDSATCRLNIPAEARKGAESDVTYLLHPQTCEWLERLRRPNNIYIFGRHYTDGYIYDRFRAVLNDAGLETGRKNMFHKIRRSVATHSMIAGLNPTDVLRHSSPEMARKHYIDPRLVDTQQPSDVLARPIPFKGSSAAASEPTSPASSRSRNVRVTGRRAVK